MVADMPTFSISLKGHWDSTTLAQLQEEFPAHHIARKRKRRLRKPFTLMKLPAELRLEIYEHLFTMNPADGSVPIIAPRAHPRTRHATALLLVSKQIRKEALPIFFQSATLTINLDPKYHVVDQEWADLLGRPTKLFASGQNFVGDVTVLTKFRNVHLQLDMSEPEDRDPDFWLQAPQTTPMGADQESVWWQKITPILYSTAAYLNKHCPDTSTTMALNIGDLTSPAEYSAKFFQGVVDLHSVPPWRLHAYRPLLEQERKMRDASEAEREAERVRRAFLRMLPPTRETLALFAAILRLGVSATRNGQVLRMEDYRDRTKGTVVESDSMVDLVKSASNLLGEHGGDVWLVLGPKTKAGNAEAKRLKPVLKEQARKYYQRGVV